MRRHDLTIFRFLRRKKIGFSENFKILGEFLDFRRIFRFLENFQISENFEIFKKNLIFGGHCGCRGGGHGGGRGGGGSGHGGGGGSF